MKAMYINAFLYQYLIRALCQFKEMIFKLLYMLLDRTSVQQYCRGLEEDNGRATN